MSPSDLRTRISEEIADLAPMATVVPAVLAEGVRRDRRRRRLAVGAAATAAALIVVGAAAGPQLIDTAPPAEPAKPAESDVSSIETRRDFDRWAAAKFDAALPERFGDVVPTSIHSFVTYVGDRRITFNINISQTDWEHSDVDPSQIDLTPDCSDVAPADCAALPKQNAIAYNEISKGAGAYAGMEMYLDDRSAVADEIALNFFGEHSQGPLPISNTEILGLVDSAEFEQIWHEYTDHPKWVYSGTIVMLEPERQDVYGPTDTPRSRR